VVYLFRSLDWNRDGEMLTSVDELDDVSAYNNGDDIDMAKVSK
jgi:hypothetical protein